MALMDEVTSGSPQAMDSIILENFKKIQLSDYPGENVRLMVHDIHASFNLLKSGQCLPITASSIPGYFDYLSIWYERDDQSTRFSIVSTPKTSSTEPSYIGTKTNMGENSEYLN